MSGHYCAEVRGGGQFKCMRPATVGPDLAGRKYCKVHSEGHTFCEVPTT